MSLTDPARWDHVKSIEGCSGGLDLSLSQQILCGPSIHGLWLSLYKNIHHLPWHSANSFLMSEMYIALFL